MTMAAGVGAAAATALLLAACIATAPDGERRAVYSCADGTRLDVVFEPDAALVTLADGETLRLPQQRAASGIWYSSGRHELRGKGDEATWTRGRRAPVSCRGG